MNTIADNLRLAARTPRFPTVLPGLALAGGLAFAAIELAKFPWVQSYGGSPLTLAIVLGIIVGNTLYPRLCAHAAAGVAFSKQHLLRLGVVLFGIRLTFQDIGHVGVAGVLIDALMLGTTFAAAIFLGRRIFGVDPKTALLIGAGSSICGAAAVLAAEPVVRGRPEEATVAVSTVVVFGTAAIFLYPALYHLLPHVGLTPLTPSAYGIYAGSTMHEVAQVVAAGRAVSEQAADTAVITKMVRVMMLAPFLVGLSMFLARRERRAGLVQGQASAPRITIPWFAFGFLLVAALNSLVRLPHAVTAEVNAADAVVLAMAMTALGLTTHVSALRKAGLKPLLLAGALFVWLIVGGFAVNAAVRALLG
jgi:uncharacterized integral membrane protein (TIGR00698 family)